MSIGCAINYYNKMLEILKKELGDIKEGELLSKHTTFRIGGPAKWFYEAKNNQDLIKALEISEKLNIDYFVLGGGSNILVSDQGLDQFVIKQSNTHFAIDGEKVICESGALVTEVLEATLQAGLTGWAWAAGLPGTIGGAIRGNAGAYGEGMGDITTEVEVWMDGKVRKLSNQDMQFKYRHSIAKEKSMVILGCILQLKKGDTASDRELVEKYNKKRRDTQPVPVEEPNPGCAFKNIDLSKTQVDVERIKKELSISDEEWTEKTKFGKLPVSFLVDKLGLKGKRIGGAEVSEKHGAFIINVGDAKAEHVVMLMSDLKMRMRDQLGILLEDEIQLVGF